MSTSSLFTGSNLFLLQASAKQATQVSVRFSQDPLAASSVGVNDALNPNNYSLTGPATASVLSVSPVIGDPQGFVLNTNVPLANGAWLVSVINIQTSGGGVLTGSISAQFSVSGFNSIASISQGAVSPTSKNILRTYVPKPIKGKAVDALLEALAVGDANLSSLAQLAFNQLTINSSNGKYLDRNASNLGLIRPVNTGMSDPLFRKLVTELNYEKVTYQSFLNVLDIFYGDDSARANVTSNLTQPYNIQDGDSLTINIDGAVVNIVFAQNDFNSYGAATAAEVAAVITRYFELSGLKAFATSYSTLTGSVVKVYSGALGLRGAVSCGGGSAQQKLKFPTLVATTQAVTTQWQVQVSSPSVTPFLKSGKVRFTYSGAGTDPGLQNLTVGNYVTIYGSPVSALNRGTFPVTAVNYTSTTTQYFEIDNLYGVNQTFTQLANNDLEFYAQTVRTINNNTHKVFAAQTSDNFVDVYLSATTNAISRTVGGAAYLHEVSYALPSKLPITTVSRTTNVLTVNTSLVNTIATGDFVCVMLTTATENIKITGQVTQISTTQFTIPNTGANIGSTVAAGYVYQTFRDINGRLYVKTAANNLVNGDFVKFEGFLADTISLINQNKTLTANNLATDYKTIKMTDGRVLITGGTISGTETAQVYIFDPSTNTYSAATSMITARRLHEIVMLNNGNIMVLGGETGAGTQISACEIYNPLLNVWVAAASMATAKSESFATKLKDGRIFAVGNTSTEVYNSTLNTWTTLMALPFGLKGAAVVTLNNGNVFCGGGLFTTGGSIGSMNTAYYIYDLNVGIWILMGGKTLPANAFTYLDNSMGPDGTVVVIGGKQNTTPMAYTNVEYFNVSSNVWGTAWSGLSSYLVYKMAYCLDADGKVIGVNGGGASPVNTYIKFDPKYQILIKNGTIQTASGNTVTLLNTKNLFIGETGAVVGSVFDTLKTATTSGGVNSIAQVTVLTGTHFYADTLLTTEFASITPILTSFTDSNGTTVTAKVTQFKSAKDTKPIGPYVFNPKISPSLTSLSMTLNQQLDAGKLYRTVLFNSIPTNLPSAGYVLFNFGLSTQTIAIPYLAKTTTGIILDGTYSFPNTILTGSVALIVQNTPYAPTTPTAGSMYLTDSVAGRIAAGNTIDYISAAGVIVKKHIAYPNDVGLGNYGNGPTGAKLSDEVWVWGSQDDVNNGRS
jgi:hypothetical protein